MAGGPTVNLQRLEILRRIRQWRGDVIPPPLAPPGMVYLLGAQANEFIFANDGLFRWREAFRGLIPVDGETALIVSDGEDHTRRRALVQPALHHRAVSR